MQFVAAAVAKFGANLRRKIFLRILKILRKAAVTSTEVFEYFELRIDALRETLHAKNGKLLVRMLKVRAVVVLPVLAAAAVGLYYWFAAPQVASTLGVVGAGTVVIRSAALVLVGVWLWRALRQVRRTPGHPPAQRTPAGPLPGVHRAQLSAQK